MRNNLTEKIIHGESTEVLRGLEANSVDSVVCDPPYDLSKEPDITKVLSEWVSGDASFVPDGKGFMSKEWDGFVPPPTLWREVFRVLKPGGHALVFAGTRTQDLMTISLRLAGFEVRDVIEWLYASGFPKSHNTHNIIGRRYKCELENIDVNLVETNSNQSGEVKEMDGLDSVPEVVLVKVKDGVLMRPAGNVGENFTLREHIRIAKEEGIKDLFVVTNVRHNGKNSLQAKIIRIGKEDASKGTTAISLFTSAEEVTDSSIQLLWRKLSEEKLDRTKMYITLTELKTIIDLKILNFLQKANTLDAIATLNHTALKPAHEPIIVVRKPLIDADTGRKLTVVDCAEKYGTGAINIDASRIAGDSWGTRTNSPESKQVYGDYNRIKTSAHEKGRFPANCITLDSDQFYSKYFNISPPELSKKASKKDRNSDWRGEEIEVGERGNVHPTVKPTDLMAWLIRLITPPNGIVLDPFAGSGSTLVAAKREGFGFVGIELTEEYIPIIEARTGTKAETSERQAK